MADHMQWLVQGEEYPVREITYDYSAGRPRFGKQPAQPGYRHLKVVFENPPAARDYVSVMRDFDPACGLEGATFSMSSDITPQYLGSFLQGNNLIDDACLAEIFKDTDDARRLRREAERRTDEDMGRF